MGCPAPGEIAKVCAELHALGVTDVVSFLPTAEATELGAADEAVHCVASGLAFRSFPIPDFGLPEPKAFGPLVAWVAEALRAGRHVVVHCRAGIGRSGMVASGTLIALGSDADTAIAVVSAARGVSIPDTVEQGEFVASFAQSLGAKSI